MVRLRALLGFLVAAMVTTPAAFADPPAPPAPLVTLQLKDGRVLHNVKVMSDEGANIVVHADEGLLKLAKSDLPAAMADSLAPPSPGPAPEPTGPLPLVIQRFDPNQEPAAPLPAPGAKPKPGPAVKPGTPPKPVADAVYKGCTIISFQMKSFQNIQGCAEVVIQNNTDQAVMIRPGEVACTAADGSRHVARNIVTEGFPPAVKRREFVPAGSQLVDIFAFSNEPLQISSVQWTR